MAGPVASRWGRTERARRACILRALCRTGGNVARAARILKTSKQLLDWHVRQLGLVRDVVELRGGPRVAMPPTRRVVDPDERVHEIVAALRAAHGRPTRAARLLGKSYGSLWVLLDRHGLRGEPARLREQHRRRFRFEEGGA